MVATILVGEFLAAEMNARFGMKASPVTVAFICAGLVATIAMVFYDNADIA
jgi:hypothetical protein